MRIYISVKSSLKICLGRIGSSVAVSSDGVWCATALPGANAPKMLVWRTDKNPIEWTTGGHIEALLDGNDERPLVVNGELAPERDVTLARLWRHR